MKVLTVSDLHQRRSLYDQLAAAVAIQKPDLLALVGDFLDLDGHGRGMLTPKAAANGIAEMAKGCEVVFVRGNHEEEGWPDFENSWKLSGRPLHALHGSAVTFGPLTIVGFPCQMGFPHFYGKGRLLDDYDYEAWLTPLLATIGKAGRGLWLMHEPPTDALAEYWACCPEWGRAVREFQPLVTISGHDHDTPRRSGDWCATIGRTQCVNVGQRVYPSPGQLLYCTMQFRAGSDGTPRLVGGIQRHG